MTSRLRLAVPAVATLAALLLSGCALNNSSTQASSPVGAVTGILHGGPNPISGATIKLYATQNNGYGGAGLQLGNSATTDANGNFTLDNATPYTCPAGQYAYVTASGGNTGGTGANSNSLLMAAIGSCSNLSTSTQVFIDELTTIAAAYSLGNFTTISGTTVNISAPANNNAITPCVANGTSCLTTAAAGLSHAFATAANLVSTTTGKAYANPPTNNTNTPALVPAAEISALGNSLQGCINSTGGSGATTTSTSSAAFSTPVASSTSNGASFTITAPGGGMETFSGTISISYSGAAAVVTTIPAGTTLSQIRDLIYPTLPSTGSASLSGEVITVSNSTKTVAATYSDSGSSLTDTITSATDGTNCGKLFADTTPSGGSVPANTLQAMINLAKNPAPSGSAVPDIFNIAPTTAYYLPTLTSAPPDWALSIIYPKGNGGVTATNNLIYPWHLALDINDTVYVMNTNGSGETQSNLLAYGYDGTPMWQSVPDTTTYTVPKWIAVDSIGHIFMTNYSSSAAAVAEYTQASGTFVQAFSSPVSTALPWGVIVDPSNDVFFSSGASAQTQGLFEEVYSGSGNTFTPATYTSLPVLALGSYELNFDSGLNLWANGYSSYGGTTSQAYTLPNTGTTAAPTYFATPVVTTTLGGGSADYGLSIDSAGVNAYTSNSLGVFKLTPSGSGSSLTVAGASTYSATGGDSPRATFIDGLGSLWTVDNNGTSSSVIQVNPTTGAVLGTYFSCEVNGTTCQKTSSSPNYPAIYGPRNAAPDSAGNLWVTSSTSGAIVEMIGIAAPTWPQISVVKFGRPQ